MYTKKDEKSFKRRRLEGEERGKQNKIGVAEIRQSWQHINTENGSYSTPEAFPLCTAI